MRRFSALTVLHVQAHADYSKSITAKIAGVIIDFCFLIVSPEMLYGIKQYKKEESSSFSYTINNV